MPSRATALPQRGQLCLHFMNKLQEMQESGHLCDLTIELRTQKFDAHRVVLAAWSPAIYNLLLEVPPNADAAIRIQYDNADIFTCFLTFLYSGHMENIAEHNLIQVLHLATSLQVSDLRQVCEEVLQRQVQIDNIITSFHVARKFKLLNLEEYALNYMQMNLPEAVKQADFLSLSPWRFNSFLSSGWVCVMKPEVKLFLIISWLGYDVKERQQYLVLLLKHIDWSTVAHDFLNEISQTENFFTTNESSLYLLLQTLFSSMIPLGPYADSFPALREKYVYLLDHIVQHSYVLPLESEEYFPVTFHLIPPLPQTPGEQTSAPHCATGAGWVKRQDDDPGAGGERGSDPETSLSQSDMHELSNDSVTAGIGMGMRRVAIVESHPLSSLSGVKPESSVMACSTQVLGHDRLEREAKVAMSFMTGPCEQPPQSKSSPPSQKQSGHTKKVKGSVNGKQKVNSKTKKIVRADAVVKGRKSREVKPSTVNEESPSQLTTKGKRKGRKADLVNSATEQPSPEEDRPSQATKTHTLRAARPKRKAAARFSVPEKLIPRLRKTKALLKEVRVPPEAVSQTGDTETHQEESMSPPQEEKLTTSDSEDEENELEEDNDKDPDYNVPTRRDRSLKIVGKVMKKTKARVTVSSSPKINTDPAGFTAVKRRTPQSSQSVIHSMSTRRDTATRLDQESDMNRPEDGRERSRVKRENDRKRMENVTENRKDVRERRGDGRETRDYGRVKGEDVRERRESDREKMEDGSEIMEDDREIMEDGRERMEDGRERMEDDRERMEDGSEIMEDGSKIMEDGREKRENVGEVSENNRDTRQDGRDTRQDGQSKRKCQDCDYTAPTQRRLLNHMERVHGSKATLYACTMCQFECQWNKRFYDHMKHHFRGPPYSCDFEGCGFEAERIQVLLIHRRRHTDERPHKCHYCSARFRTRNNLIAHFKCHSNDKDHECPVCHRRFRMKNTMEQHLVTHSDLRPYLCDTCGFSTKFQSHLISHKRIHTGEVFTCSIINCHYSSPKRSQLKAHMRSHLNIRHHQCDVCHKSFVEKSHLVRHLKIHQDIRPHKCDQCEYSSTRVDKVNEHRRKYHSEDTDTSKRQYKYSPRSKKGEKKARARSKSKALTTPLPTSSSITVAITEPLVLPKASTPVAMSGRRPIRPKTSIQSSTLSPIETLVSAAEMVAKAIQGVERTHLAPPHTPTVSLRMDGAQLGEHWILPVADRAPGAKWELPGTHRASLGAHNVPPREDQLPPRGDQLPPRGDQLPPGAHHVPPGAHHVPPRGDQLPPGAHHVPPRGDQLPPGAHHVPPREDQFPPGAHHVPPREDQLPAGAHHVPPSDDQLPPGAHQAASDWDRSQVQLEVAVGHGTGGRVKEEGYLERGLVMDLETISDEDRTWTPHQDNVQYVRDTVVRGHVMAVTTDQLRQVTCDPRQTTSDPRQTTGQSFQDSVRYRAVHPQHRIYTAVPHTSTALLQQLALSAASAGPEGSVQSVPPTGSGRQSVSLTHSGRQSVSVTPASYSKQGGLLLPRTALSHTTEPGSRTLMAVMPQQHTSISFSAADSPASLSYGLAPQALPGQPDVGSHTQQQSVYGGGVAASHGQHVEDEQQQHFALQQPQDCGVKDFFTSLG